MQQRMQYHLCAVMTNNFSNYLYALVEVLLQKKRARFQMCCRWSMKLSADCIVFHLVVQTGPAIRKDRDTIQTAPGNLLE